MHGAPDEQQDTFEWLWSGAWLPGQQSYVNKFGDKLDILSFSVVPAPGDDPMARKPPDWCRHSLA